MARVTKGVVSKAREDKARRARLELDRLTIAVNEATTDESREAATTALNEYYEDQAGEVARKEQLAEARVEARRIKAQARGTTGRGRARIQWADGGRSMVPGLSAKAKQFHAAAEGNLVKCSREISRWETSNPYENVRGIRRGEILMVIGDNYMGDNNKSVVDVMVGPDIVKGVPAAALRPLDG